jgi:SAM-dependent MidA family methyltransferase
MLTPLPIPPLTDVEARHASRVAALIRGEIAAAGGWIPFSRFMQLALYAPGLGYYSAGARKFGAGGDFITAPELTPVFSRCIASQVAELLGLLGGGNLLELGAGSGVLAADLLEALAAHAALPAEYRILEVSGELRARQRETLAGRDPRLLERVRWIDSPPEEGWRGVVLANEVADALPVERFRVAGDGLEQLGAVAAGEGFALEARAAPAPVAAAVAARLADLSAPLPVGYESEACLLLGPWLAAVSQSLEQGAMLFLDYGLPRAQYYHPSRAGGSLCSFFRHRRVADVLARPGLQDITAWVDFTALAEAGLEAGFGVAGFATQAHFLLATGLERELAAAGEGLDAAGRARLAQAAGMLISPGEMGERFKVMALARGVEQPLSGFSFRDLSASL